ncbi:MAG: hypothetical protein B6D71_03965 [gamma proteobacterium symbiont of Stewartia floridana]|nr:MAG: hypothetical protein B6D71_03965 [gamma proteobacterium symbiont of Stewartia floridana]
MISDGLTAVFFKSTISFYLNFIQQLNDPLVQRVDVRKKLRLKNIRDFDQLAHLETASEALSLP